MTPSAYISLTRCDVLALLLEQAGCGGFEKEVKFCADRRFRFDLAWKAQGIAAELDGAVFSHGRHTRGSGFVRDCEKMTLAATLGWRVLRFTTWDLDNRPLYIVDMVQRALGRNGVTP
jgi:hypothetical protein